jgi:hypothetical protein
VWAIKRYQNRMRYLAARLRPPVHEPDRLDILLHWLVIQLEPIQGAVESDESVVILCWRLIREGGAPEHRQPKR